jgi:nanoRNase/pAp phosphatase (c-di-AMP/oligoRNAs hydrolase)
MDLVLFHQNCPDGWAAAYICKMKYPEAELLPLNHGLNDNQLNSLFNICAGKDVIMVDYSLRTRELNDQLNLVAKSFRILDHHKTAQAALNGAEYATFDMKRSGAGLAWDYLFGKDCKDRPAQSLDKPGGVMYMFESRPWWVNYTEDQDLWNWALPDSQLINAWLMVQPRTMETWDIIQNKISANDARRSGMGVREYIEYYTRSVVAEAQEGVFEGYKTGVLNIPYVGVSEAGAALIDKGYDIGLLWFERGDGITQFSLRSLHSGNVDVSAIAKKYGGGGHGTAAGFQLSMPEGRILVDKILNRITYTTFVQPGGCVK